MRSFEVVGVAAGHLTASRKKQLSQSLSVRKIENRVCLKKEVGLTHSSSLLGVDKMQTINIGIILTQLNSGDGDFLLKIPCSPTSGEYDV